MEFGGRRGRVRALDGIRLDIREREFRSLVGTSGCGKSTLLMLAAGLQTPTGGRLLFDGAPIMGPSRDRGVVFQAYSLYPWLTVQRNVEFPLQDARMSRKQRAAHAREMLDEVGLLAFADAYPNQLSGGMRQRVALARALVVRPRLLLMDEPFGALDAQTRQLMQELLTRVWEEHPITVLFVTHDIEEAVFLSDRVALMTNRPGRVKEEFEIDLPRPRRVDVLTDPAFLGFKERLLRSLREESLRLDANAGIAA
jgi:ABC-type nitrate/sulfonate/bicarbonate transport system ATPase subunit